MYEEKGSTIGTPYLSLTEKNALIDFKRSFYSEYWSERGVAISSGQAEPLLKIMNSNMFFVHWELSGAGVSELNTILAPRGLQLAPIKILESDIEIYLLTWNLYDTEFVGINPPGNTTVRFEASVYVTSVKDPVPRFLVLEALSSDDTLDPVEKQVSGIDLMYSVPSNILAEDAVVSAQIPGPSGLRVEFSVSSNEFKLETDKSWIVSNDKVYWLNGVFDKIFYDSKLANQQALNCTTRAVAGSANWTYYIADLANPVHAFSFQNQ